MARMQSKEEIGSVEALETLLHISEDLALSYNVAGATEIARLIMAQQNFARVHAFTSGMIVQWKPGMRNRRLPLEGRPAVVIAVITTPRVAEAMDFCSPHYQEPLDIVVGILDSEGDLMTFYVDSRRIEPWLGLD